MKKKKGRIISLLLAATMLTSVVPATAFAGENLRGGTQTQSTTESFFTENYENQTVKTGKDAVYKVKMNKTLYKDYSGENKNFVIEIKNGNSWTTLYSVNSEVLTTGSITVEIKQKDVQNIISKTDKVTFRFKAKNNGEWCYSNEFTVTWSDILFTQQPQNKTAYIGQNVNVEFMVDHDVIGKDSIALWEFNGTTWNNLRIYSPYSVKANTPATITI